MKIWISDLKEHVGQTVELKGWVYNHRSSGKIKFLVLRDGTGFCQCVFVKAQIEESVFNDFEQLTQESSVSVTGTVRAEPRSPGGFEITATTFKILHRAENYPISPKEHGTDFFDEQSSSLDSIKTSACCFAGSC